METEKSVFNAGIEYSKLFVDLLQICIISSNNKNPYVWLSSLNSMYFALSRRKMQKDEIESCDKKVRELHSLIYGNNAVRIGSIPFDIYLNLSYYQQTLVTIADRAGLLTATVDENANLLR